MSDFDFNSLFSDSEIEFECPQCGHEIIITLNDVGSTVKCPSCSIDIELQKDNQFTETEDSINESLKELNDTLNNFGK